MSTYIFKGGFDLVKKSGVGKAMSHQDQMLEQSHLVQTDRWKNASVIHINTVLPDSVLAAVVARMERKKVVYYGHSTMEDFKNSFKCSDLLAPLFKWWICFCYGLGDVILTPTEYSRGLLEGYGLKRRIYSLTNGIDTDFFHYEEESGQRFRKKYHIPQDKKAVVSVGHFIERKGILDFIALAEQMPDTLFYWFGGGNAPLVKEKIKNAMEHAPENVFFPGYVEAQELRDAYCGADAFIFMTNEETEGIVVLEALACEIPVILRDIPVYENWLVDGREVYKAKNVEDFRDKLYGMWKNTLPDLTAQGRRLMEHYSLYEAGKRLESIYRKEKFV